VHHLDAQPNHTRPGAGRGWASILPRPPGVDRVPGIGRGDDLPANLEEGDALNAVELAPQSTGYRKHEQAVRDPATKRCVFPHEALVGVQRVEVSRDAGEGHDVAL